MTFKFEEREGDGIEAYVYEALGAASMCWTTPPRGEFASQEAEEIGKALLEKIRELLR